MAAGRVQRFAIAATLLVGGIGGAGNALASASPQAAEGGGTLVVDKSFDLVTMDPNRMFETAGGIIIPAMYDTLLTFENNDTTEPKPSLAASWEANEEATEFTFTLRDDAVFSDGSPVEAADVVFSLNRVRELKSSGSFLMDGVTAEAVDASTVVLRTEAPNPALPSFLPTPTLGIVNSDVVKENGGSDQPGADGAPADTAADTADTAAETEDSAADVVDTAEEFLNSTSAGSGPYILESFSTTTETVIARNPEYVGPSPATFDRIVFRNAEATTQAIDVQNGNADIAMDLSSDQLAPLRNVENLTIVEEASPTIFFLFANADPAVSDVTSNPDFVEAVRYGLDYEGILELGGAGAIQPPGVIPSMFLGALAADQAVVRDVPRAQEALARCDCEGASVQLEYPSDITPNGLAFGPIAERIVANLDEVGISVELTPGPLATTLETYREGDEQMGLWLWNPDYPDSQDYLLFGPGQLVGERAGWPAGAHPEIEAVSQEAATTVDNAVRGPLFEQFQVILNESGPFFPLIQPAAIVVSVNDRVTGVGFHPTLLLDVKLLAPT